MRRNRMRERRSCGSVGERGGNEPLYLECGVQPLSGLGVVVWGVMLRYGNSLKGYNVPSQRCNRWLGLNVVLFFLKYPRYFNILTFLANLKFSFFWIPFKINRRVGNFVQRVAIFLNARVFGITFFF